MRYISFVPLINTLNERASREQELSSERTFKPLEINLLDYFCPLLLFVSLNFHLRCLLASRFTVASIYEDILIHRVMADSLGASNNMRSSNYRVIVYIAPVF